MSNVSRNIVCVKWGKKYSADYVNKLFNMVQRNLTPPFRFICFTDDATGLIPDIETREFVDKELTGWWLKLELFRRSLDDIRGSILFLDLDVVIIRNIDCLFEFAPSEFCIIQDQQKQTAYNSSVFRFEAGQYPHVWERFHARKSEIVATYYGDQDWISENIKDATLWPSAWIVSYKKQCSARMNRSYGIVGKYLRRNGLLLPKDKAILPNDSLIVYFHGKPDPEDVMNGPYDMWKEAPWIKDHWR
jgi:hypothetical protein